MAAKKLTPLDKATHKLWDLTTGRLCLLVEIAKHPKVFLLVENGKGNKPRYQLSNGMDGFRTFSYDFTNLKEAIKEFDKVCKFGWDVAPISKQKPIGIRIRRDL